MQVFDEGAYPRDLPAAVSIGVYDGVHLGHRHVLSRLHEVAAARGLTTVVVTFDPHPAFVVAPERAPALLCTLARRLELLELAGIERCVVVAFDTERATQDPTSFATGVLVDSLAARAVVVGENFRFGRGRSGDVALLSELAAKGAFDVEAVPLDASSGEPISSTAIRRCVELGDVEGAAAMLGRPHMIEGTVAKGDGRGRELGFPTANLALAPRLAVPKVGIYAGTWTRPSGERLLAAVSVGRRPTFYEDADVLVEAHLVDFDEAIYGERGRLAFTARLRDEARFEDLDALCAQIARDVAATRAVGLVEGD